MITGNLEPAASPADIAGPPGPIRGVVIGWLAGFDEAGRPLVDFAANPSASAIRARMTATCMAQDVGRAVALLFEGADPLRPLIIGPILEPGAGPAQAAKRPRSGQSVQVSADGQEVTVSAGRQIVLRCGKASITLTRAGKVLIRGAYVLTRSSGVNRVKGGSVQIN